jgi:hypothetical protein
MVMEMSLRTRLNPARDAVSDKNARFSCEQALRINDMMVIKRSESVWDQMLSLTKDMSSNMGIDSS